MKRKIMSELINWKNSSLRKPLILNGARQVGKTYILKEFGETFSDGYLRIDFKKEPDYINLFDSTNDVTRLLKNIEYSKGKSITTDTLLILDEIQECPSALNSLKYFCEECKNLYVACAGSLLGIALAEGFPVGKVDFLNLYPMNFEEFLDADGCSTLVQFGKEISEINEIPDIFVNQYKDEFKLYCAIGGMPEAVQVWITTHNMDEVEKIQNNILISYSNDFSKHSPASLIQKLHLVWNSIPSQLAKENKKFLYSVVKNGARAREYEDALKWIENAGLLYQVNKITKPGFPLSHYEDLSSFKVYSSDIGLLRKQSDLPYTIYNGNNKLFSEFKGALFENYCLNALISQVNKKLYYWAEEPYEVDFIMQLEENIIPIEVKSGENVSSLSVKKYAIKYKEETKLIVRFSMLNLRLDGNVLNIPLYLIDQSLNIISLAISQIEK